MLRFLRLVGQRGLDVLESLGRAGILLFQSLWHVPSRRELPLYIKQVYQIGVKSMGIIVLSAFSIGAVLTLQFYTQLARFGAEEAIGLGLALTLLRELGPVVTGLLFAGRAGSALTAEIGLMKATDQLSSMAMMGVDPLHRIVAPRLWAGFLCLPLLALVFSAVAIWGGSVVGIQWLGIDDGQFWAGMQDGVEIGEDIGKGVVKCIVFGVVVNWISVYQGYDCVPTSEGISTATTDAVVFSSIAVLALDFLMTLVMYGEFR